MARTPNRSRQTQKLLAAMLEKPLNWRHGYELLKATGLQSGTLYPVLLRLSDQGVLEAQWREGDKPGKPPRHVYRLTKAGLAFAREQLAPVHERSILLRGAKA
ncbi:MAG TPA: helix-turn-helix transcriptional regulator [Rhizomicrobium sp.]|jgi:DNA-binding PadR family transcriptional regulator|nr:helix-turn-helix transcriptional regulator [Rhizomicrobium sp.]